jgi:hypothetical protein
MGRLQGHLVDLIVVDIPNGEEVLGLDLQDRENSIPMDFNNCDGSEYDNLLKIAEAVLQKDGVIKFMRPLFIAAHMTSWILSSPSGGTNSRPPSALPHAVQHPFKQCWLENPQNRSSPLD